MTIDIDRRIFNDVAISKTVYCLSGDYVFRRKLDGDIEHIIVTPKYDNHKTDKDIEFEFLDKLNDYKLRGIIAEETREIRTILYAKAFSDDDDLSVNDLFEE